MLKIVQVLLDAVKEIQLAIENFKPWGVGFKEKMKNYEFGGHFPGLEEFIQRQEKSGNFKPIIKKDFHMSFDAESKRVHEESIKPTATNKEPEYDLNWLNENLQYDEAFKLGKLEIFSF